MENYSKLKWTPGWYIPVIIFLFDTALEGIIEHVCLASRRRLHRFNG